MELYPVEGPCEGFEPVWTCGGILQFPQRVLIKSIQVGPGQCEEEAWEEEEQIKRWEVPDYDKWLSVPGFPDFLEDPTKLNPAFVRPLTADERRAYLRGKAEEAAGPREMELSVRRESVSIRINGKLVGLSPREFELLSRTIEESPLSHKRAVQFVEGVQPKSPGGVAGFVDARALADHRKSILAKVEREAGRQARVLLGEAFRSRSGELVYDRTIFPERSSDGERE